MNTSKHQKSGSVFAIFSAVLAVGLSGPTSAADYVGPDVQVRYGDLAIDTEKGSIQLLKRIESAANRVCAKLDHGDVSSRSNMKNCQREVTVAAINKVNHPMLLAVCNSKKGVAPELAGVSK